MFYLQGQATYVYPRNDLNLDQITGLTGLIPIAFRDCIL